MHVLAVALTAQLDSLADTGAGCVLLPNKEAVHVNLIRLFTSAIKQSISSS